MIYTIVAIAITFFIAGFFENESLSRISVFTRAFLVEFSVMLVIGFLLLYNQVGFFSGKEFSAENCFITMGGSVLFGVAAGVKSAFPHIK